MSQLNSLMTSFAQAVHENTIKLEDAISLAHNVIMSIEWDLIDDEPVDENGETDYTALTEMERKLIKDLIEYKLNS